MKNIDNPVNKNPDDNKWKSGHRGSKEGILMERKYKTKITEELSLGPLLKYTSNNVPFLNIYIFEEAFSFPLVSTLLTRLKAGENDYVLDPFCGLGTTLFTSLVKGIPSVGVDALPLAQFMAKTLPLFLFLKRGEITKIWKSLLPIDACTPAIIAEDVSIMRVAFQKNILLKLKKMKTAITNLEPPYNDIFLFLFFSILKECSTTVKEKRYPTLVHKNGSDPVKAMTKKVNEVERDIAMNVYCVRKKDMPDVFLGDTKTLPGFKRTPTIILTSPPYADTIDYTHSYALELCFHFVKNGEELKALQKKLLRSHLEAQYGKEEPPHPAVKEVAEITNRKIADMVTAYFLDMKTVIQEWFNVLHAHGRVAVVVDNVCYTDVVIPVDFILSDVAEDTGFTVEKIIIAQYKKGILRESILMWKK